MTAPLLSLRNICKAYGGLTALQNIDLDINAGEVLAICGDNGAGKSSLIRIISGAAEPSTGKIILRGRSTRIRSPLDALRQGIATIYQDLALAPRLSIAANVFMGAEHRHGLLRLLDKRRMHLEARGYLARLAVDIADARRAVETLSGGQRQAVAIARALRWDAGLIIMDEPTAALGVRETAEVIALIRHLHAEGRAIVLISHNMQDVVAVADRVAILQRGRKRVDRPVAGLTPLELGRLVIAPEDALGAAA